MTVGDILDGAFKLLKANVRTLAVIVASLVIPFQVVGALLQRNLFAGRSILTAVNDPSTAASRPTGRSLGPQVATLIVSAINLVLVPFVAGAISKVVAASYLGEQLSAGVALRATLRRWWSLLASWLLIHLLEIGPMIAAVVLLIGLALISPILLVVGIPLLFASILPGLLFMALFVLSAPAIVTEQLGPIQGMRRSWRLARRRVWAVMGVALLAGLMAQVLGGVLGTVPQVAALAIGLRWGWILLAAGSSLVSLVVTPFVAIVATLQYFDARIRHEGFDLQVIAAAMSVVAPPAGPTPFASST